MDGIPCRGCREDCGEQCLSLLRARARALDAALACGGAGLATTHAPYYLAIVEDFL